MTAIPTDLRALGAKLDLLVEPAQGDARKLAALALAAEECGRTDLIYPLARDARALAPRDPEILALTQNAIAFGVQPWHVHMLRDDQRPHQYRAAIERMVRSGDRVLDIGAGTGLLAMMAARAGAAHVHSCEAIPGIADVAREIIALNGFADRITIIARRSTQLDAEADLGGRVDALVSEVLGSDVIGENVLPTMEHAVAHLLKPGGRMVPRAATLVVALAEVPSMKQPPIKVGGFDLSLIARLSARPQLVGTDKDFVLRSTAANLYGFDFTRSGSWGEERASCRLVADGGVADGVLMWMRVAIDETETYDSHRVCGRSASWVPLLYRLDEPRLFAAGETVTIEAVRRTAAIQLWVADTPDCPL